jgi:hypothetical protein
MTLRTACKIRDVTPGTLTATDTCIGYHVTRFEASRSFSKRDPSYALRKHMCESEKKAEYDKQYRMNLSF